MLLLFELGMFDALAANKVILELKTLGEEKNIGDFIKNIANAFSLLINDQEFNLPNIKELYENGSFKVTKKELQLHDLALNMLNKYTITFAGHRKPYEVFCFSDFAYISSGLRFIYDK